MAKTSMVEREKRRAKIVNFLLQRRHSIRRFLELRQHRTAVLEPPDEAVDDEIETAQLRLLDAPGATVQLTIQRGQAEMVVAATLSHPFGEFLSRIAVQNQMGGRLSPRRTGFSAVLQHDTVLNPEFCGGSVVNLDGIAVGVNIARAGRTETYAIPADVVLDQIALPCFGGTGPQALAAGTPVISSYEPSSTSWLVGEPAPILPAFNPAEVRDSVCKALDPAWRAAFSERARNWVDAYHHPNRVLIDHLRVYQRILWRDDGFRR